MEISYHITLQDIIRFNNYVIKTHPVLRRRYRTNYITVFILPILFYLGFDMVFKHRIEFNLLFFSLGLSAGIIALILFHFRMKYLLRKAYMKQKEGFLGDHLIRISPEGLLESTNVNESFYKWDGFIKVEKDQEYYYYFIQEYLGYFIPKKAFSSEQEAETFYNQSYSYFKHAKEKSA